MTVSAKPLTPPAFSAAPALAGAAFWPLMAGLGAFSLAFRQAGLTPDVSWLLDMCQRMLNGEKAYIDIFETTPPVPALLYMPGAFIAQLTGLGAGATVYATCYAALFYTLYVSDRILPQTLAGAGPSRFAVIAPAAFILFILCNDAFAQREHLAAAFILPLACVFMRRAETGEWPAPGECTTAALLAGLAAAIKPPLLLAPLLVLGACHYWREQNIAFLWRSGLIFAGAVGVALTALSLIMFPAYLDGVTQLMRDVYVPLHSSILIGLTSKEFIGVTACLLVAFLLNGFRGFSPTAVFAVALAVILTGMYFVQGKYFPYHLFPAAFFGGLAFSINAAKSLHTRNRLFRSETRRFAVIALTVMIAALSGLTYQAYDDDRPRMRDLSWAKDLDRPTALAISTNISIAFPLAQEIGAVWADRIHSQWVVLYAEAGLRKTNLAPKQKAALQSYYDSEIDRIAHRIEEAKPDIIIRSLADQELYDELLNRDPRLLNAYKPVAQEGVIQILKRY